MRFYKPCCNYYKNTTKKKNCHQPQPSLAPEPPAAKANRPRAPAPKSQLSSHLSIKDSILHTATGRIFLHKGQEEVHRDLSSFVLHRGDPREYHAPTMQEIRGLQEGVHRSNGIIPAD